MQQNRWFPKEGDLVSIPPDKSDKNGVRPRCNYGIVVRAVKDRDFAGVWWEIFTSGRFEELHIHCIRPLADSKGRWLQAR